MKTIKEAAQEYANRTDRANSEFVMKDFQAGVEFAQHWISVKEELPPVGVGCLLFKEAWIDKFFNPTGIRFGYYHEKFDFFIKNPFQWTHIHWCGYRNMFVDKCDSPTHWRPIELK